MVRLHHQYPLCWHEWGESTLSDHFRGGTRRVMTRRKIREASFPYTGRVYKDVSLARVVEILQLFTPTANSAQKPTTNAMMEETKTPSGAISTIDARSDGTPVSVDDNASTRSSMVPWSIKLTAVILISSIGFGSHWSTGVTGAMKSTLKKASTFSMPS